MKQIHYIFFSAIVLLASCEVEPESVRGRNTERGKLIYDEWNAFMSHEVVGSWLDMALRFNVYYSADSGDKIAVEDSLLTDYKIRQNGSQWELRKGKTDYFRFRLNKPLSQVGAHWECWRNEPMLGHENYTEMADSVLFVIDCVSPTMWHISVSDDQSDYVSKLDMLLEMSKLPDTMHEVAFNLTCEGVFALPSETYAECPHLHFKTTSALQHSIKQWQKGSLQLCVFNHNGDEVPVVARFLVSSRYEYQVEIAYRGTTEIYSN